MVILVLSVPLHALVDFYGYRGAIPKGDSLIHYTQTLLGYSELEVSEIKVEPQGSFLDITEDAWISSDVNKLNISGLTSDYLFKGSIPLPKEAIVTGLQTWRGEKLFRASLHPSEYIVDTHYADSSILQQSLDSRIALLQQHTEVHFEITLARVALGERIHVRLRYLLRPQKSDVGHYLIPVLFHTEYGQKPRYIKFTVVANSTNQTFKLTSSTGQLLLDDTLTSMVPYEPTLALQRSTRTIPTLNLTEFSTGAYCGNFMSVNTGITDSIVEQLSKPIGTVFVWRWNGPPQMTTTKNGIKTLSDNAWKIIQQAKELRETIIALQNIGNSCALIHTIEGQTSYAFESSSINSRSDTSAITYLRSMNEMALFEKYKNESIATPDWVVKENGNQTVIQQARDEFASTLSKARHMLESNVKTDYRHIIIVTLGGTEDSYRKDLSESVIRENDSITISAQSVVWRGIDINATLPPTQLYPWEKYLFPAFSPTTIQLTAVNSQQPYSFPLKKDSWQSSLFFTARTGSSWDTALTWTGFDAEGKVTRSIKEYPLVFRHFADSGLAKLWAGDHSHIAEKEETFPGGTFGILTKSTFFRATINDTADDISLTVPYLDDDEIIAPRSISVKKPPVSKIKATTIRIIGGNLHITSSEKFTTMKVYDLGGRLLLNLDLRMYYKKAGCSIIPLSSLIRNRSLNMLIITLSSKTTNESFHLVNGRIK